MSLFIFIFLINDKNIFFKIDLLFILAYIIISRHTFKAVETICYCSIDKKKCKGLCRI